MTKASVSTLCLLATLCAGSLAGQETADPRLIDDAAAKSFGSFGSPSQDFWITALEFVPFEPSSHLRTFATHNSYWSSDPAGLLNLYFAPVRLPAGARVTGLRCDFYDADAAANASVSFERIRYNRVTNTPSTEQIVALDTVGSPGYHEVETPLDQTIRYRIGEFDDLYQLALVLPDTAGTSLRFRGCRLIWNRQVSAINRAPTFDDVPNNHPYFQFVEALVDSGITAGCGGGNFCVSSPITRGEMAVFLAVALGLHFPY